MKKVRRKSALTTSPITLFNFGRKTFEILKVHIQDILKETMEKLTFPLYPMSTYEQDHEKQKRCGTSYQSLYELQNMFR